MSGSAPLLEHSIGFALLAAGGASRFGGSKLIAPLAERPLWRWSADAAMAAGFYRRICIVADEQAPLRELQALSWSVVVNPDPASGMASSIKLACAAAAGCHRLVIALADMPFVTSDHLIRLAGGNGVVFTRYPSGRIGVPAAFPQDALVKLATLHGDRGAASLDWGPDIATIAPESTDTLIDVDRPADLIRARAILARS